MARISGWVFGLMVIAMATPVLGQAQRGVWESIAVQDLKARIGAMESARVQLIGHVSTVNLASAARADRYILNGYKGGNISIQTTMERPLPTTHVFIRGTVNVDAMEEGFIVEAARHVLDPQKVTPLLQDSLLSAIDTIAAGASKYSPGAAAPLSRTVYVQPPHDWMKIGIIGVAVILVVTAIVILLIVALKPKPEMRITPPIGGAGTVGAPPPPKHQGAAPPDDDSDREEMTVVRKGGEVRQNVDEKTVIPLPGWLEVLAGGQPVGSKIRLIGPQHSLLGRKSRSSQGVNFIALEMDDVPEEEKKTLSRKQVKIAYDKANDEFTAENVGTVGTVVWLDRGELAAGHSAPLTDGTTLKMEPYWEFRFHKGRPV